MRAGREVVLTPLDRELLQLLERSSTLVDACRRLGISRDRGGYRLRRLARAIGSPVSVTRKGGSRHGGTRLTGAALRLLREEPGTLVHARGRADRGRAASTLHGTYGGGSAPTVSLPGGPTLFVAFDGEPGETVAVEIDPESIVVATERFDTSARNVLAGTLRSIDTSARVSGAGRLLLRVRVGAVELEVAATGSAVAALGLRPGRRVFLYVKATAVRRRGLVRPTRGSLPR